MRYCVEYIGPSESMCPGQGGHPVTKWRAFETVEEAEAFLITRGGEIYKMDYVEPVLRAPDIHKATFLDPETMTFKEV